MKSVVGIGLVIGFSICLWQVSADARFLDIQKNEQPPALNPEAVPTPRPSLNSVYTLEAQHQYISLQFQDHTFVEVLLNIQEETGILFSVDPSIEAEPYSVKVQLYSAPSLKPAANSTTRTEDLPPHILFKPGVLKFFKFKGIQLLENVKSMFGPNLEGLPANMPTSPHILNDPMFINFLNAQGIQPPQA